MESMDVIAEEHTNVVEKKSRERIEEKVQFEIDAFSGPLDVLLSLVKQHKIDIYDISIVDITEQYLMYIKEMVDMDLEHLTDFYQVAAWLLLIKSRMLLPLHVDIEDDDFDTPKNELINTLIEFQKYKKLSGLLSDRYEQFNWLSLRKENNILPLDIPKESVWKEVQSLELFSIFMKLMDKPNVSERIIQLNEPVTINEKMALIYEKLDAHNECSFDDIVDGGGVLSVVCALLALLELMKQQYVKAVQHRLNEEIKIIKSDML